MPPRDQEASGFDCHQSWVVLGKRIEDKTSTAADRQAFLACSLHLLSQQLIAEREVHQRTFLDLCSKIEQLNDQLSTLIPNYDSEPLENLAPDSTVWN